MLKILDLGMHPFADTFIDKNKLHLSEPCYPLECFMNSDTGEISLGLKTKAFERYNLYDYSYTSSNSNFSQKHWIDFSKVMDEKFDLKHKNILEIGSNDGFLLQQFKNSIVTGVDASECMVNYSNKNGIKTIMGIFDLNFSKELNKNFDFIIANNVMNHANDILSFASGVCNALSKDGTFVFEVPYWGGMIESLNFDQIYHEHISYFTFKYLDYIFSNCDLNFYDFEFIQYHGKSIRGYVSKNKNIPNQNVKEQILLEEQKNYFKLDIYNNWQENILKRRFMFMEKLNNIKKNYPMAKIVGVGAAAKGNTFLNFCKIDNKLMDFVTDKSDLKQNKFTPLSRIPIKSDDEIIALRDLYVIILSWNISEIIRPKLEKLNNNIKFLDF